MEEEHVFQLSLICPTIHGWDRLIRTCQTLQTNLDMEIVFVGPINYLISSLIPIPHRFVISQAKLVQACQIGMQVARGETVGLFPDDELFSSYAWDEAYALYKESNDYKTIAAMNWWEVVDSARFGDRGNFKKFLIRFGIQLPNSCSVMSRKFFWELGGYDSNFIKRMFDMDFFMKAIKNGAIVKYCEERPKYGHLEPVDGLWGESPDDMVLYENKWAMEEGVLVQKIPDRPFVMGNMEYTIV